MKKLFLFILLCIAVMDAAAQLPNIDRTCKDCERRYLDSINVFDRRPIRLNQIGFRPQDYKYAYVADPVATTFKVIDAHTLTEVQGGGNLTLINPSVVKPNFWVNGAFNSLESVYSFGSMDSVSTEREALYRADFTSLSTQGEYFLVVGNDTSATFHVHSAIYNAILEKSLQFFGIQRCGNTNSHFHAPCHLQDGSAVGHDLTGGWHDCGDHFKVSETLGYTAYVLSMVYLTYQDKAEDRYGNSYADTVFTDGIPDILYEAKIGADYILKLYNASKKDGLIARGDMYHSVGVDEVDHAFWDKPERQDAQVPAKGGPDRVVLEGTGANVAGMFAAALANVATGYMPFDPVYADSLLTAAKDIYANVLMPAINSGTGDGSEKGSTTKFPGFYTGGGPRYDDGAAAALALWYATADTSYRYDLYKNTAIFNNQNNYRYNLDYFRAGFLGNPSGFTQGGWATDYQNIHAYVVFALEKLILSNETLALEKYGLTPQERDTLSMRTMATFRKIINDATNDGDSTVLVNPGIEGEPHEGQTDLKVIAPYNLVWTSFDWGVIRYNLGTAVSIFLMYELTKDERYLRVALDNMYYALGANPWDISFLMGAGEKNPQHPHNRSANPDGYNAGGIPYEYRCPVGALMGGRAPHLTLIEDWSLYTSTETCIDFSAQFLFPAQSLAETLPVDAEGPLYSNIAGTPISDTEAIISWDANEVALTTVFYNTTPDKSTATAVQQTKASKGGSLVIPGLTLGETYYFFLEGMDTKRNLTTDDNHGQWYQFTMTTATTNISGVTICQVDHRSAKIYWWSSSRMNGTVNFGTSPAALTETAAASGGAVMFHEVTLNDLKAGTTYYFNVSSGATTDDNGGASYSFTTESYATYADLDIYLKPSAYQDEANCNMEKGWENCSRFIVEMDNNDTTDFEDFEVRLYLGNVPNFTANSWISMIYDGTGTMSGMPQLTMGSPTPDGVGGYYLPITVNSVLPVSGRIVFQLIFNNITFKDLVNAWSFIPHTGEEAPEQFKGIDLTRAPLYTGSESAQVETLPDGSREVAVRRDPYITVHYHGKHIYGYGPDYTPENGPQTNKQVALSFVSPFVSPHYSVEKVENETVYAGGSKVSPTGFLDDFELNGISVFTATTYANEARKDSFEFNFPTTSNYGNNYYEWVSWHNHGANAKGSYDCACAVVRSNVEIDSIVTPPEQRYLVFHLDTIEAYTGRMAEVHLQLLDSSKALLRENITVLLNSGSGLAEFFTSPDATIPVEKIDIIKGEAVFYVKSNTPTETQLNAVGNTTAKFAYENAQAALIIRDLPPYPIIDKALIVDANCDYIPDRMDITLSSEYDAAEGQSFNAIKFVYKGDTLTSNKVLMHEGREMQIALDIRDTSENTSPIGFISLLSNVGSKVEHADDFYKDGIAPLLMSVSVLERYDTATTDRVYLQFSEAIQTPSSSWILQLFPNNNDVIVKSVNLYNDSLNVWEYEIAFDEAGNSLVVEGMEAQLLATSGIKDLAGNGLGECAQRMLPVLLKIRPYPMQYAAFSDSDRDGLVEFAEILFTKPMDEKHLPNQVSLIFGSAHPETLWVEGSALQFASDNMNATITLEKPFTLGNTDGPYENGAGLVVQHLGEGVAYEKGEVLAEDKAGPVIASATLASSEITVLSVRLSEEVELLDSNRILILRERDNAIITRNDVYSWTMNASLIRLVDTTGTLFMDGDRIRLAPMDQSAFADLNANLPAENNPWITIGGNALPKIDFAVGLRNNLSIVARDSARALDSSPTMRTFVKDPASGKLFFVDDGVITKNAVDSTELNGAVWVFDLTIPRGAAFNEPAAWKILQLEYELPIYTNLGTFVNRTEGELFIKPENVSSNNKFTLYVEWVNAQTAGVRSQEGRAVGTGAYIYKIDISTKFTPNLEKDEETQKKFSGKQSYDKTKTFGIKRVK